jgi:hypothetical protein
LNTGNGDESLEGRDFEARAVLVADLNEQPAVKDAHIRVVPWDRPGVHNSCLILVLPNPDNKTDAELVIAWQNSEIEEVELPESIQDVLSEIICDAYQADVQDNGIEGQ